MILKFRLWDKQNKLMVYPDTDIEYLRKKAKKGSLIRDLYEEDERYPFYDLMFLNGQNILKNRYGDDIVIMPYIGQKDINNKEIYKDDIIRLEVLSLKNNLWVVNFEMGIFYLKIAKGDIWFNKLSITEFSTAMKVVGNIHENPELIKYEKW